jgi:hypothetical protein
MYVTSPSKQNKNVHKIQIYTESHIQNSNFKRFNGILLSRKLFTVIETTSLFSDCLTLKMKALDSPKSPNYWPSYTASIPEDLTIQQSLCENLVYRNY